MLIKTTLKNIGFYTADFSLAKTSVSATLFPQQSFDSRKYIAKEGGSSQETKSM